MIDHPEKTQDALRKTEAEIGASLQGEGVAGKVRSLASDLSETASQAYDRGAQVATAASNYASESSHTLEAAVRRNPIGSVIAALTAGLVIGLIASR